MKVVKKRYIKDGQEHEFTILRGFYAGDVYEPLDDEDSKASASKAVASTIDQSEADKGSRQL